MSPDRRWFLFRGLPTLIGGSVVGATAVDTAKRQNEIDASGFTLNVDGVHVQAIRAYNNPWLGVSPTVLNQNMGALVLDGSNLIKDIPNLSPGDLAHQLKFNSQVVNDQLLGKAKDGRVVAVVDPAPRALDFGGPQGHVANLPLDLNRTWDALVGPGEALVGAKLVTADTDNVLAKAIGVGLTVDGIARTTKSTVEYALTPMQPSDKQLVRDTVNVYRQWRGLMDNNPFNYLAQTQLWIAQKTLNVAQHLYKNGLNPSVGLGFDRKYRNIENILGRSYAAVRDYFVTVWYNRFKDMDASAETKRQLLTTRAIRWTGVCFEDECIPPDPELLARMDIQ